MTRFLASIVSTVVFFGPAQAATVGSSGVEGLIVNGKIYNVTFNGDTCSDLFPPCDDVSDFPFAAGFPSEEAAVALANAINASTFRNTPTDFIGCEESESFGCSIATPNGFQSTSLGVTGFGANVFSDLDRPVEPFFERFFTKDAGAAETFVTFATWEQVTPVPLPATAAFLMTGLGGMVLMGRKTGRHVRHHRAPMH